MRHARRLADGSAEVLVVKLGGSLAEAGSLRAWLALLAEAGGRAVIVPGGGPFAELVREEQHRLSFSDGAAHRMAILGMEQYAILLADLLPCLAPAETVEEIRGALAEGAVPLWRPARMALAERALPESWDVTSDSLALWLAGRLGARRLALVKSVAAPRPLDIDALAASGMVDRAFPRFFAENPVELEWVGPGEEAKLRRLLLAAAA